jgi:hypothetical protein
MLGTNPRRNLSHPSPSRRGDAQAESLTSLAFIKFEIPGTVFRPIEPPHQDIPGNG